MLFTCMTDAYIRCRLFTLIDLVKLAVPDKSGRAMDALGPAAHPVSEFYGSHREFLPLQTEKGVWLIV